MYLENITIQNYGPLKNFVLDMPFNQDDAGNKTTPKPLVIVGKNGTGKTVILSHIVNFLMAAKQEAYDDSELTKNFVYKIRSPFYINNAMFYYAKLNFTDNQHSFEYQLSNTKREIEATPGFLKPNDDWDKIPMNESSCLNFSLANHKYTAKKLIDNNIFKYFPSDRKITPAWLNSTALTMPQHYSNRDNFSNISNRSILSQDDFDDNKRWILDLILDRELYSRQLIPVPLQDSRQADGTLLRVYKYQPVYVGPTAIIYNEILKIINTIFNQHDILFRIGVGSRANRQLGVIRINDNQEILPNIAQLSLGQSVLLNLFLSIVRDADYNKVDYTSFNEMTGIVLIDEIENHLHNDLISKALPELIKLFPKIQFIITSHSPIFLLGMENTFGEGFQIIELDSSFPNGYICKTAEEFSEFQDAFSLYKNTHKFNEIIKNNNKPLLITEGETDSKIISKAWNVLHPEEEMPFDIIGLSTKGGSGASAINSILSKLRAIPDKKIIGIFDADLKGVGQFHGLNEGQSFSACDNQSIKIKERSIFATYLPVPDRKAYMEGKEDGFEIEDYFSDAAIEGYSKKVIKIVKDETGNESVNQEDMYYRKFSGKKAAFSELVLTFNNADGRFNDFQLLFDRINEIIQM